MKVGATRRRSRIGWRGGAATASAVSVLSALVLLVSSCARFDDAASSPFSPEPTIRFDSDSPTPTPSTTTPRPTRTPGPCVDPDEAVVATCLDSTGGIAVLPDAVTALVAERRTGRIVLDIAPEQRTMDYAQIDVDGSGDGGLLDLALSPTYLEDGLVYAYISTPYDNRVVRIAEGDSPKEILTGIPKGATGNNGALDFVGENELMVLTGNAGDPALAADPNSLAGKLLRITDPKPGATAQVVMSGIGTAGDICPDAGGVVWVTDRTATEDRLQKLTNGVPAASPAWTWADRPGVTGCAAGFGKVAVALNTGKAVAILTVDESGAITTAPAMAVVDQYGLLGGAALGPNGLVWVGTVNKTAGTPGPNDDRVFVIPLIGGGGGGNGPD